MSQVTLATGAPLGACQSVDYLPEAFDPKRFAEYGVFQVWYGLGQNGHGAPAFLMVWRAKPAMATPKSRPTVYKFPQGQESMRKALGQPCVQEWLDRTLQGDDRALLAGGGTRLLPESAEEHHALVTNWLPYN